MAVQYYQTAADKHNHTMSELRLGMHYLHGGLGLTEDFSKAFFYIERAAKGGLANAQYLLGMMYRDGKVAPSTTKSLNYLSEKNTKHKKEAFYWIRKAAAQRLPSAITQIANCYEEGVGTAVNHALATEYYDMATSMSGKHLASAQQTYACFLHKNGKYEQALEMYLYAAGMKPNPLNTYPSSPAIARTSKRMVAIFYLDENDTSTPYEPRLAFDILTSLANTPEGDADAHYWIAVCYEEGVQNIIPKDLQKAYQHYLKSANLGSSDSQFQV
jgi:TPR repeat protein